MWSAWFYLKKKTKQKAKNKTVDSASEIPFWSSQLRFPPAPSQPLHPNFPKGIQTDWVERRLLEAWVCRGLCSHSGRFGPDPVVASGWQYRKQKHTLLVTAIPFFFLFLDIRQRLGKRPYSPEKTSNPVVRREPFSDVHSRLGVPRQDTKGLYSDTREKKSGWWHFTLMGMGIGEHRSTLLAGDRKQQMPIINYFPSSVIIMMMMMVTIWKI